LRHPAGSVCCDAGAQNPAIVQAYATVCYTMEEIARAFGIHYATVIRLVKNRVEKV
jgi:predicted transcriptional regulator